MPDYTHTFFIPGTPVPGGSKTAFKHPHTGRIIITDAAGKPNKLWRQVVAATAREHYQGPIEHGAIELQLVFYLARPKGHFGTGKNLGVPKDTAPRYCLKRPDTLKLARAVEDALTGVVWHDDSQIVHEHLFKRWSDDGRTGCDVTINFLDGKPTSCSSGEQQKPSKSSHAPQSEDKSLASQMLAVTM